jgi:hypothetical protein
MFDCPGITDGGVRAVMESERLSNLIELGVDDCAQVSLELRAVVDEQYWRTRSS